LLTGSKTPAAVQVEGWKPKSSPTDTEEYHWHSSIIVTRESPTEVKTQSGTLYRLEGQMDIDCAECKREEWSEEILKQFKYGFPNNWQELLNTEAEKLPKASLKKKKKRKHSSQRGEYPAKRRKLTEVSKTGKPKEGNAQSESHQPAESVQEAALKIRHSGGSRRVSTSSDRSRQTQSSEQNVATKLLLNGQEMDEENSKVSATNSSTLATTSSSDSTSNLSNQRKAAKSYIPKKGNTKKQTQKQKKIQT